MFRTESANCPCGLTRTAAGLFADHPCGSLQKKLSFPCHVPYLEQWINPCLQQFSYTEWTKSMQSNLEFNLEFNLEYILLVPHFSFKSFKFSLHVKSKYQYVGITLHHHTTLHPSTEQECDCKHTEYNKTIGWVYMIFHGVINYNVNIHYNLYRCS